VSEARATLLHPRAVTLRGDGGLPISADVATVGSGARFVFLHGLVGLNEHWEEVVSRVHHRLTCTTLEVPLLDLRGPDCSIQGVTELTLDFLRRFVGGRSVLVGNSFGGHVALRIARYHPELVRGLVLAGSSGLIERTMVKGAPVRPSKEWLEEKIGELFYDKARMSPADVERAHRVLNEKGGARAMVKLSKTARRNYLGDELEGVQCPTLLIWGKQDIVTPPSAAQGFMDLLPDARIRWIDRCGHAPMLESPEVFAEAVLEFAAELDGLGDSGGRG
jgi:pimeloyl-ACP methyl ester carboxylesterase